MTKQTVTLLGDFLCKEFINITEVAYLNGWLIVEFIDCFGQPDAVEARIPSGNTVQDSMNLMRDIGTKLLARIPRAYGVVQ